MSVFYQDGSVQILHGDAMPELKTLPDAYVQTCVTSPPYWGLRDYGVEGQIGREKTPEDYVQKMVDVFREVRRVLKEDGTLWLNLGDSFYGSWGNYSGENRGKGKQRSITNGSAAPNPAYDGLEDYRPPTSLKHVVLKPKDLVGIPWRVAFALQADGWYLRSDIIWHKPNPMPESVTDRPTKAHEYLFLLSKSERYYYDHEAIKEPANCGWNNSEFHTGKSGEHQLWRASKKPRTAGNKTHKYVDEYDQSQTEEHRTKAGLMNVADVPWEARNKRTVWTVASQPYKEAHFATFPPNLIEPCILAGSRSGDVVLDPFHGAGTTAMVSKRIGRRYVGIELNREYIEMSLKRVAQEVLAL